MGGVIITAEGSGTDTKYYVQKGADAASKKALGAEIVLIGSWDYNGNHASFVIDRPDKGSLTEDNFFLNLKGVRCNGSGGSGTGAATGVVTKTYDKETGTLTISKYYSTVTNVGYARTTGDVYLIV